MSNQKGRLLFTDDEESDSQEANIPQGKLLFSDEENSSEPEKMGWTGVGQDIKGIPHRISEMLSKIPEEASGVAQQYNENPARIGKNLLAGVGEAGESLLNAPHDIIKYLQSKQITPEWLNKYNDRPFTHIPDLGIEEKMGLGQQQPGDAMLRAIPGLATEVGAGTKLLREIPGFRPSSRFQKELDATQQSIKNIEDSHAQQLGQGQEHGARAARQFLDTIEGKVNPETGRTEGGLRRQVGSQYDKLNEDLAKENVVIETSPDMKAIQKEISKLGKAVTGEEKEKLLKVLSSGYKQKVSGADALTSYRELKHQAGQAYKQAYKPGADLSPKSREQWIKKGDELTTLEKRMKLLLEDQIGGKYLEKLKKIDTEYATKIAPLYKNPMYQEMRKKGQTSKNIMKELHGTTQGNKTLNSIVEQNPEMQRLIVGQQYAAKPEKLAHKSELLDKYARMNPHISHMINEQKGVKLLKESKIPELEKSVQKARDKKMFRRGLIGAGLGTGAGMAIESALGRDWKEDVPLLNSLLLLRKK